MEGVMYLEETNKTICWNSYTEKPLAKQADLVHSRPHFSVSAIYFHVWSKFQPSLLNVLHSANMVKVLFDLGFVGPLKYCYFATCITELWIQSAIWRFDQPMTPILLQQRMYWN